MSKKRKAFWEEILSKFGLGEKLPETIRFCPDEESLDYEVTDDFLRGVLDMIAATQNEKDIIEDDDIIYLKSLMGRSVRIRRRIIALAEEYPDEERIKIENVLFDYEGREEEEEEE